MKYFLIILNLPFFILGWILGFISRPLLAGWAIGFSCIEQKERLKLINQIEEKKG